MNSGELRACLTPGAIVCLRRLTTADCDVSRTPKNFVVISSMPHPKRSKRWMVMLLGSTDDRGYPSETQIIKFDVKDDHPLSQYWNWETIPGPDLRHRFEIRYGWKFVWAIT